MRLYNIPGRFFPLTSPLSYFIESIKYRGGFLYDVESIRFVKIVVNTNSNVIIHVHNKPSAMILNKLRFGVSNQPPSLLQSPPAMMCQWVFRNKQVTSSDLFGCIPTMSSHRKRRGRIFHSVTTKSPKFFKC